ncbi:MAG: hypothetical protein LUD47_06035 [Clostridia bacterium]|nr:hypothetical protein [Clostridia bacterium]
MATVNYDNGSDKWSADYSTNFALIEKIAKSTLYQVQSSNPLRWMSKGQIANGVAIEDALVELADSYDWKSEEQDGSKTNAPSYPSIKVTYNSIWNGKQFKTTVSEDQIRKVLLNGGSESDVAQKIVSNLTESEGYEGYLACKGVLENGRDVNILPVDDNTYGANAELLKAIKNTTDKMQFVNTDFVSCGSKQRTPFERIHIVMPYEIYNAINIDVLASLYNLDKAELIGKITLIDEPGYIYIVDEFGVFTYTRLYKMTSKYVEDGLYENYWLTMDRMFGTNNLFKMAYLKVESGNATN